LTDADLIRGAQNGDRSALQTLYERYLPTVWRYAYAHGEGRRDAVEDVVSETFLALVRQIQTLHPKGGALGGWLITVARRKICDARRRRRAQPAGAAVAVVDSAMPVETSLEQREFVARVLDGMNEDERLALEWKYVEMLSVRKIAKRLGRTEKGVESLLFRARRSFRESVDRLEGA